MTRVATCGAATLIAAISVRAPLAPCLSISHAVLSTQQPGLVDLDARLGDQLAHDALLGERAAERDPGLGPLDHQRQRPLGHADRAHAVVDAARARGGPGRS